MDKLISVIIPVYNCENYVSKCIDSVLNQTYKNIEIILINDGSTDDSLNVIKKYEINNRNIVIFDKKNGGVSSARNDGLNISKGDFIMFLDSDDYIDNDMISSMIKYMTEGIDIVRCGYVKETFLNKEYFPIVKNNIKYNKNNKKEIFDVFLKNYKFASVCCQIIRKSKISNKFYDNVKVGEDYLFNLNLYSMCEGIYLISSCYYHYFENSESLTNKIDLNSLVKRCSDAIIVYSELYDYSKLFGCSNKKTNSKISYRIFKELNYKLMIIFKLRDVDKKVKKDIINKIFMDSKMEYARLNSSIFNVIKIEKNVVFIKLIYLNLPNLYYLFGEKIYGNLIKHRLEKK